jgi:hypothetical protein
MKVNWFLFCIAFAIAGLIAYGFFAGNIDSQYRIVIVSGAFLSCFVPLAGMLALKLDVRGGLNLRLLSLLFVIGALVVNIVFNLGSIFSLTPYIIVMGILLLLYTLAMYGLVKALQDTK